MEKVIVIKCGGSTIDELPPSFFQNIEKLKKIGLKPIIVHGGGPAIQKMLEALKIKSEFINGLRKTTKETMEVVEMVLAGKINKALVYELEKAGINAIGISGVDGLLLEARAKDFKTLGFVGNVTNVNVSLIQTLLDAHLTPVIAPIGINQSGERLNINADSAAGAIANALKAKQLIFVTDVPGILKDGSLIEELTEDEVLAFIKDGTITGGMIPKVEAALNGLRGNVLETMIVDGKSASLVKNGEIVGTKIKKLTGVLE